MAKKSKWNIFVGLAICILLLIILEESISVNKVVAPITKSEQQNAISIAELYLAQDLHIAEYKIFVGKTGKYFYTDQGRKKVIEVTFSFGDKTISALVDVSDNTVVQVSRTQRFGWMTSFD